MTNDFVDDAEKKMKNSQQDAEAKAENSQGSRRKESPAQRL